MPIMYGQKINTYKLYCAVMKRGGYDDVTQNKKWREVGRLVVSKHKQITNLSFLVRVAYERSLLDFEKYVEKCSEYLQRDTSHLDALSHVCVSGDKDQEKAAAGGGGGENGVRQEHPAGQPMAASPVKKARSDPAGGGQGEDTEMEALDGLIGLTTDKNEAEEVKEEVKEEDDMEAEEEESDTSQVKLEKKLTPKDLVKPEAQKWVANGGTSIEDDSLNFIEHMLPQGNEENEDSINLDDVFCELCGGGAHEDQIILCDKCDKGFHTFCLAPPLDHIPAGDWCCPHCISSATDELAFLEGSDFSVEEFQKMDKQFQGSWFGAKGLERKPTWWEVEDEFWNIVENSDEPCEVFYGADLDSGSLGSGFPHQRHGFSGQYADSPWNLNNLPKLGGKYCSMLRHVTDNINGVIVPWLYMGMTFSSFCWHVEDHMFYSINYNHVGNPKVWYGVPSQSALAFEEVFKKYMPEQFKLQPDLLFQLVTMLSPRILKSASVPVYRVVQEEGSFVITFPRAYHGGFNSGFNCAEAVNFAPADWFDFDQDSVERYREYRRNPVLSHEALLCKVCEADDSPITALSIHHHLKEMILKEAALRQESHLQARTFTKVQCTAANPGGGFGDDDAECAICKQYMHLSACKCKCTPGYFVCLEDMEKMCTCDASERTIVYRRTLAELEDLYTTVLSRIEGCDVKRKLSEEFGKYVSETPRRVREAEAWALTARDFVRNGNVSKKVVEDQIKSAEKFLWGGHAMDEVRELVKKLQDALEWGSQVASCLAVKRRKLELAHVKSLLALSPKPLDVDVSRLENWVKETERMNGEAARALDLKEAKSFTFDGVKDLLTAANRAIVVIPLLDDLTSAVTRVEMWAKDVQDFLLAGKSARDAAKKPPFSALTSLMKRGSAKIPGWSIRERFDLQDAMDQVEAFQKRADDEVIARKPSLAELAALLSTSSLIPVSVPQLDEVQRRQRMAKEWLKEVSLSIEKVPESSATAFNLKEMRKLLHQGERIPVDLELNTASLRLELKMREWTDKLKSCFKQGKVVKPDQVEEAIQEGLSTVEGVDESHALITEARTRVRRLKEWQEREREIEGRMETAPVDELRALVEEGKAVGGNIAKLQKEVKKIVWERKAKTLLGAETDPSPWDDLEVHIKDGKQSNQDPHLISLLTQRQRSWIEACLAQARKLYLFPTRSWRGRRRRAGGSRKRRPGRPLPSACLTMTIAKAKHVPPAFHVGKHIRQHYTQKELKPLVELKLEQETVWTWTTSD